jgi:hypothetical protein
MRIIMITALMVLMRRRNRVKEIMLAIASPTEKEVMWLEH